MTENGSLQMAIDMLRCHLGLSEDEAREELGIHSPDKTEQHIIETQSALLGLMQEK